MRIVTLILFALTFSFGANFEWNLLSADQKKTALEIYELAKPYGLEHTMIAISWQESKLNEIPINIQDKTSCGAHHIHLDTFIWIHGKKNSKHNRNVFCSMLIKDLKLSTSTAISVFQYYKQLYNGNWNFAIRAYNTGKGQSTKAGEAYLSNIKSHLKKIMKLDNENPHLFREQIAVKYQINVKEATVTNIPVRKRK